MSLKEGFRNSTKWTRLKHGEISKYVEIKVTTLSRRLLKVEMHLNLSKIEA